MQRGGAVDWAVLAFLVAWWSSSFAVLKVATAHISPLWNTAGRLLVAIPVLAVILAARGQRLPPWRDPIWRAYAIVGLSGMAVPFALYGFSAQRLPSAVNAICNGATPIFTGVLAHAFSAADRLTLRKGLGTLVGFAGLVVLVAPQFTHGMTVAAWGLTAALIGAVLYAVSNVLTRTTPAPATTGALMMCLWSAPFSLAAALIFEPLPPWPGAASLAAMTALGVVSTALGTIGYVFLIHRRGPLFMSMGIYLAPLGATAVGILAMGERPGWPAFVALGMILAGVGLVTVRLRQP